MAGAPLALCLSRRPPLLLLLLLPHALSPPAVHAAHRQGQASTPAAVPRYISLHADASTPALHPAMGSLRLAPTT